LAERVPWSVRSVVLDPKSTDAYGYRGRVWIEKKDLEKAIADSTEAIRLDPNEADAYSRRGYAYREIGELDKANADFAQAAALGQQ
jgi:Flp pilus assembly protein TadD